MSTKAEETAKLLYSFAKDDRVRLSQRTLSRMSTRKLMYFNMRPTHVLHLGTKPGTVFRLETWDYPLGKLGAAVIFDSDPGLWWFPFSDLEHVTDE